MDDPIGADVEWTILPGLSPYPATIAAMEARAEAIRAGTAREAVWLLEHPPLYTAGTSAAAGELLLPDRFPVYRSGRGGRYTYHGPGQRVGYLMIDLDRRGRDVRRFVHALEDWLIVALAGIGIAGRAEPGRVGIWTDGPRGEAKIGAIGVRIRRWVSLHGFAINLAPELAHFTGIVPCGISEFPVTSAAEMGANHDFESFDSSLFRGFPDFLRSLGVSPADRPGGLAGEAAFRLSTSAV